MYCCSVWFAFVFGCVGKFDPVAVEAMPKYPAGPPMKSRVIKRSTLVDGRKTSVTLEDEFWTALKKIATTQNIGTPKLISMIDSQRQNNNLSSAIRVYVLRYYRERCDAKR